MMPYSAHLNTKEQKWKIQEVSDTKKYNRGIKPETLQELSSFFMIEGLWIHTTYIEGIQDFLYHPVQ